MTTGAGPGRLVLVVGPSGAGKDTLIDGARRALAGDDGVVFARREISRPADAGGEDHLPVSEADFHARAEDGAYALHWTAHGLCYGVPRIVDAWIDEGRTVVVNGSRTVVDEARRRYARFRVAHVTAPESVLTGRLLERGREDVAAIAARVRRAGAETPEGSDVFEVMNAGTIADGVARLVAVIRD